MSITTFSVVRASFLSASRLSCRLLRRFPGVAPWRGIWRGRPLRVAPVSLLLDSSPLLRLRLEVSDVKVVQAIVEAIDRGGVVTRRDALQVGGGDLAHYQFLGGKVDSGLGVGGGKEVVNHE